MTRRVFKPGLICLAALVLAATGGRADEAELKELLKKRDELKARHDELAVKATEIAKELGPQQAKLDARYDELEKTAVLQGLRKTMTDAKTAMERLLDTDPRLKALDEAREKAQAAVEATRNKVLGATITKERNELDVKKATLEFRIRESDFAVEHHAIPRIYRDDSDLTAAARKKESLRLRIDQARRGAETGSEELKNLRAEMTKAKSAYDKAYKAAMPGELGGLRKLAAEKEADLQRLAAEKLKAEDEALSEAQDNAAKARNQAMSTDGEVVALREELADLHKQKFELEYRIALTDFRLREGAERRIGFDPKVQEAEDRLMQAKKARQRKEQADPAIVAARKELDELRRKIGGMEVRPDSLPEVAAARTAWQEKEKAFNELRAGLLAKAVAGLQPEYDEAAEAEEALRDKKFENDQEMAMLTGGKPGYKRQLEAVEKQRQELDAKRRTLFEETLEDKEVKAAIKAAADAAAAYDSAYAASKAPALKQAIEDAETALRDKTNEIRYSDKACVTLFYQVAEIRKKANDLDGQIQNAAKDLAEITVQIAVQQLKPAALDRKDLANGLALKCFETQDLPTSDFDKEKPVKIARAETVDISLRTRDENIGLTFEGYIEIPKDGEYTFSLTSDDGSFLYLDGKGIIDNGGHHGPTEKTRKLTLSAGMYPIKVTFFQGGGALDLAFSWSGPGIEMQPVPASAFYSARESAQP